MKWGKKPTKYFMALEKQKARDKCITKVIDSENKVIEDTQGILESEYKFYNKLYSSGIDILLGIN